MNKRLQAAMQQLLISLGFVYRSMAVTKKNTAFATYLLLVICYICSDIQRNYSRNGYKFKKYHEGMNAVKVELIKANPGCKMLTVA